METIHELSSRKTQPGRRNPRADSVLCCWALEFILLICAVPATTRAQTLSIPPSVSHELGPCSGNQGGQDVPVYDETSSTAICVTASQFGQMFNNGRPTKAEMLQYNPCASGEGYFGGGIPVCEATAASPGYYDIDLKCLVSGFTVVLGPGACADNDFEERMLADFSAPGWISEAIAFADIVLNQKPGYETLCNVLAISTANGDSPYFAIAGAATDEACEFVSGAGQAYVRPTSYSFTSKSITGTSISITVDNTPATSPPVISQVVALEASNGIISASPGSQLLQFTGTRFLSGLEVRELGPTGQVFIIQGSEIQNASQSSFQAAVDFDGIPGKYQYQVLNPDGSTSNVFNLAIGSATVAAPAALRAIVH